MNFLAEIQISKKEAFANAFGDPYSWHKALWKAFPGQPNEKRFFLFRVNEREDHFQIYLLSELPIKPQKWGWWRTKEISKKFLEYKQYVFQLRANPTMRLGIGKDKGKRVGIYRQENLKEWFTRKAGLSGFYSNHYEVSVPITDYFIKNNRKNKLNRVDFQGVLKVTDRNKFTSAFHNGVGSAKALGYGMLVLQPIG